MFKAPESDAAAGFRAPDTDEDAPKWSDLPGNIIPDAMKIGKGAVDLGLRTAKGVYDLPQDVRDTATGMAKNAMNLENPYKGITDSPLAEDAKTIGKGVVGAVKAIPGQAKDLVSKEGWVERPVGTAMTAASILVPALKAARGAGAGEALVQGAVKKPPVIPKGIPEVPPEIPPIKGPTGSGPISTPKSGPEMPAPAGPSVATLPKDLPVIPPGAKTGDPHALFSYNDNFGPGGAPRSQYTVFGDLTNPVFQKRSPGGAGGHGSTMSKADVEALGIPIKGREPRTVGKWEPLDEPSSPPPPPPPGGKGPSAGAAGEPPPKGGAADPLQDVKDYINSKYGKAASSSSWPERAGKYLQEETRKMRAKDLGLQMGQIKQMGPGMKGVEKAEALIDYAASKGYFKPGLSDIARKDLVMSNMENFGRKTGAIRDIASQRAKPNKQAYLDQAKAELESAYGIDAPGEVAKVMAKIEKKLAGDPSFSDMADLATELNKSKTSAAKMNQHPGPTTDAANIISRINNDQIRAVLNPQEAELYTQVLRDFGAHKKLEQAVAGAERKQLAGRGAPGSITNRFMQEILDKGGYRVGGNVADKMSKWMIKNPDKARSLPQFFEELLHSADDVIDDALTPNDGMYRGGRVPDDVRSYVNARGC